MATDHSTPSLALSTDVFNYSLTEENSTSTEFGNLSFENTSSPDYYANDYGEMLTDYTEYQAAVWINNFYLYIVCAIGIPGNVASIVTLTSMRPCSSYEVYMLMLAVSDTVVLTSKMVYFQVTLNDIQVGSGTCSMMFFVGTMSLMYSNWTLVVITIERFIAIWFPFKVKSICTQRAAVIVNMILILILTCANWHFLLTFEEVPDPLFVWDCKPRPRYVNFVRFVWYWLDGILYAFLPVLLIVTLNCMIVYAVRKTTKSRFDLTNSSQKSKAKASHQRQLTMMLLTISLVFVLLVLPNCIFFIVREYWTWQDTVQGTAQYFLLFQLVFVLSDLNHAINFYLYCLSGRKFRQSFIRIVCFCYKRDNQSSYSLSCRTTVEQRRHTAGEETSLTNIRTMSTSHQLLQATNSNDSILSGIAENSAHI